MNKESVFDAWAPEAARWSRWVKPVLFACMDVPPPAWLSAAEPVDVSWAPAAAEGVALVLDLPGALGVHAGLELARHGYQPVPLYNAIPMPLSARLSDPLLAPRALVEVLPIMAALWHRQASLVELRPPVDAPPAFLLDWDRNGGERPPRPGEFDNRSVSFTTDFPSANFLLAHGIHRALLVQPETDQPRTDLAHTLRRWQEAGVAIELKRLDLPGAPMTCVVPKPSWFGWAWQRVLIAAGLRRGKRGGFGDWVPEPSSG